MVSTLYTWCFFTSLLSSMHSLLIIFITCIGIMLPAMDVMLLKNIITKLNFSKYCLALLELGNSSPWHHLVEEIGMELPLHKHLGREKSQEERAHDLAHHGCGEPQSSPAIDVPCAVPTRAIEGLGCDDHQVFFTKQCVGPTLGKDRHVDVARASLMSRVGPVLTDN